MAKQPDIDYTWPWLGYRPTYKETVAAVYRLIHSETGRYYIGSTTNLYKRMTYHLSKLRNNAHEIQAFQDCFNQSKKFELVAILFESESTKEALVNKLRDAEQDLLQQTKHDSLKLNKAIDSRFAMKGMKQSRESVMKRAEVLRSKMSAAKAGVKLTDSARAALKERRSDPETRRKMRLAKEGIARPVRIHGKEYKSTSEASLALGVYTTTLRRKCLRGTDPNFQFINKEHKPTYNIGVGLKIDIAGRIYSSIEKAAVGENVSTTCIRHRCKSSYYPDWKFIR